VPKQFDRSNEHLVVLDDEVDEAAALEAIERVGGRVLHRIDPRTLIVVSGDPAAELSEALPPGARVIAPDAAERAPGQNVVVDAFHLRATPAFREAKDKRPHANTDWGEGGLDEPDVPDPEGLPGRPPGPEDDGNPGPATEVAAHVLADEREEEKASAAKAVVLPTNERLINDVAVGIVLVGGTGDFALSADEETNIVAEVQEGLSWLAGNEPNAKVTWVWDVRKATVTMTPWKGARWPGMPESFYKGIDAAVVRQDNGKLYMFKDGQYVRFSSVAAGVDAGYPKPIAGNWPGLPAAFQSGIDAVLWRKSNGALYMFKGNQYVRFTKVDDGVDAGYPKLIADSWPGLPAAFQAGIDAALMRKDTNQIYFFKGNQYIRYSDVSAGVDAGFPKPIDGNWKGVPDSYEQGIDAALWRDSNGKIYLFKNGRFNGTYVRISNVPDGVDAGYENGVPIGLNTAEAEALWRDPALTELGFATGDAGRDALVADLKSDHDTQWAYAGFFTKHPTTWFAYTSDHRTVIRYSDFSAGAVPNLDRIVAHETGHIFGCPDEYASSNCACGANAGKFFTEPNDNCANCAPDPAVPCIMRSNSPSMCAHTPWHVGWGAFLTGIDAALWRLDNNKIYLFSGNKYVRITDVSAGRDDGYPRNIAGNWPGLPAAFQSGIDAALWRDSNGAVYLFKGSQYVRFSKVSDGVDSGYPKSIADDWPGLPAAFQTGIDAALLRESNGKIYFFKGNQYVRFSDVSAGVDAGYPKPISGSWPGLPASFTSNLGAALMRRDNHKIYFFKGTRHVRFDDAASTTDPDYPRFINGDWLPFPK
jgi:hemopexin